MKGKDLLLISDLTGDDIQSLISDAIDAKDQGWVSILEGKALALLFEKPSLRHRVSFEVAMRQSGGPCIYLSPAEVGLGERESVADVARVLSRYVDCIAARTFSHQTLKILANCSDVPVINALSDLEHPCQALADLLTIYEKKGELEGLTLAYIGDANNVAHSLLLAAALTGINFQIASPPSYTVNERILNLAHDYAQDTGSKILCTEEPRVAVIGADIVYTDVWTSMGFESSASEHLFDGFQVNEALISNADPRA
ncbi:MAG: ornithine carbamoyltransferase, partial [Dehalococcoidales bacterium]|nr:ornithine carbamoyltransferase [Dehalococcoidales bacterium]